MTGISVRMGFSAAVLLLGLQTASAFTGRPVAPEAFGLGPAATPAAMCGYTCRSGGRYIPGPPSVCYDRGLEYCGSSRGGDADYGYGDRGGYGGGGRGGYGRGAFFDEGEYLRCHPDVRRAVQRGTMESGFAHYQRHGRGEGRRLSC